MKTRRRLLLAAVRTFVVTTPAILSAQSLNIHFGAERQALNLGSAGAIPVPAAGWNNANGNTGNLSALIDNTGAPTAAAVSWTSANTWSSGATLTTGNGQLTRAYLDDGAGGCQFTVTNNPFLLSNVYLIVATDQGGGTQTGNNFNYRPVTVNGTSYTHNGTATIAGTANWGQIGGSGERWRDSAPLAEGLNYLKIPNVGGLNINVKGSAGAAPARGSIAGIQIENAYSGAMLYWDLNGATAGSGGPSPAGTWDGATANWSTSSAGTAAPGVWTGAGKTAVFSAGTDATGSYAITVSGTQTADAVMVNKGNVSLTGGNLALVAPAVLRTQTGTTLAMTTPVSGSAGAVFEGAGGMTLSTSSPVTGAVSASVPSMTLNTGAGFPAAGSFSLGTTSTLIADHATIQTTAGISLGTGSTVNSNTSTFAATGDLNLNGAGFNANGTTAISAANLSLNNLGTGNAFTLNGGSTLTVGDLTLLNLGTMTLNDSSVFTTKRFANRTGGITTILGVAGTSQFHVQNYLVLGDNTNAAMTVNQTGGTVINDGTVDNPNGNDLSNRWGHWGNATTLYNLSAGTLNLTGAPLYLSWDSAASLNISGSGTANLKGVNMGYANRTNPSTINLTGGRLNIGSAGIVTGGLTNKVVNLGAGTLGAMADWSSPVAMNVTAAHTVDSGAFTIELAGVLSGAGSVAKTGAGTLCLSGANTYTGATAVTQGSLQLGGTLASAVTVASGAGVRAGSPSVIGNGSVASLNLGNGSQSFFRLGTTADQITVTSPSALTTGTSHVINIEGAFGLAAGTYPLFKYGTAIAGSGFGAFSLGNMPHMTASLVDNTAASSVDLNVTAVDALVWSGANGSVWDLNGAQNWKLQSNSAVAPFFQTDLVRFNDSALTGAVTLTGTLSPGDIAVNNSSLDYVFSGAGIRGFTDLFKEGTAKLTLLNENTYTGKTIVDAGTLQVGDGVTGSISPASAITVAEDAQLILKPAANLNFANPLTLAGTLGLQGAANITLPTAFSGAGDIVVDSTGTITFTGTRQDWTGDLTVNNGKVVATDRNTVLGAQSNTRTLTFKAGTRLEMNINNVFGVNANAPAGVPKLVFQGGTLFSNSFNVLGDLTLDGATVDGGSLDGSAVYRGFEMRGIVTVTGSTPSLIKTSTAHENHLGADSTFDVGDVTSSAAVDLVVSAPFMNASPDNASVNGGLIKIGPGTMELTAANLYTGATNVQEGELRVTGSLAATEVTVSTGARLSGAGTLAGKVICDPGSTLAPGASAGTLAIGGDAIVDGKYAVEIDGATADRIDVAGALDISQTQVEFSVLAGGANQPVYVIAQYGTLTGTAFSSVTGLPAGYSLVYNYGPNTNQIALVNGSLDPYQTWAATTYGLSGANALGISDPDKDGIPNAVEFVIGGNPNVAADNSLLPTATLTGGNLVFTFRRTDLSAYANPVVEYGSDLTGWTTAVHGTAGVTIAVTNDGFGTGVDKVVVSLPQALASGAKIFARLKVAIP